MATKQQLAFRRAWAQYEITLKQVNKELKRVQSELELLKERKRILIEDIKVFKKLIVPDEKFTSP